MLYLARQAQEAQREIGEIASVRKTDGVPVRGMLLHESYVLMRRRQAACGSMRLQFLFPRRPHPKGLRQRFLKLKHHD